MAAVDADGGLQALVCTDNAGAGDGICLSCQQICHTLNTALEARSFTQAAALGREDLPLDADADPQLGLVLTSLREAMLEAIFEFESMTVSEVDLGYTPSDQYAESVGIFA